MYKYNRVINDCVFENEEEKRRTKKAENFYTSLNVVKSPKRIVISSQLANWRSVK